MFLNTMTFVVASLAAVTDAAQNSDKQENVHRVKSPSTLVDETASSNCHDQAHLPQVNQDQGQQPRLLSSNDDSMDQAPDVDTTLSTIKPQNDDNIVFNKKLAVSSFLQTNETQHSPSLRLLDHETGQVIEWVQFVVQRLPDGNDDAAEFCHGEVDTEDTEHLDRDDDDPGDL
ncbi:hypothetical protein HRG_005978 [Hirsutella rhossiliensis]|uniref:Uncharacterized protein n=1 Tax=Hirsutella rhossiliensis TaxID=111463 RepID=A0A9P8SHT4_9HYPO|nr:uncharacterized protein HRG_05978 [Hirsutella rhossiliensis]KAH0963468.1 hypothetical protein HRG_05978 [Hirsutella rhossiliensis]